jgi:hypothetical protein
MTHHHPIRTLLIVGLLATCGACALAALAPRCADGRASREADGGGTGRVPPAAVVAAAAVTARGASGLIHQRQ